MPEAQLPIGRLLASAYDAERQAYILRELSSKNAFDLLLGRLRFDVFLYDRIVIPVADLLDGSFFLTACEDRSKIDKIPWRYIEIRSSHVSMEDALFASIRPDLTRPLVEYSFASIDPSYDVRLRKEINEFIPSKFRTWEDIGQLFERVEIEAAQIKRLLARWSALFSAVAGNDVTIVDWNTAPPFSFGDNLFKNLHDEQGDFTCNFEDSKILYHAVINGKLSRSQLWRRLRELRMIHTNKSVIKELDVIETWFDRAYKRTQADQHECGSRELMPLAGVRNWPPPPVLGDSNILTLPDDFLTLLGSLDASEFNSILQERDVRGDVRRWHSSPFRSPPIDALAPLIEATLNTRPSTKLVPDVKNTAVDSLLNASGSFFISTMLTSRHITLPQIIGEAAGSLGSALIIDVSKKLLNRRSPRAKWESAITESVSRRERSEPHIASDD